MTMHYEELDGTTRRIMLAEFEAEQSGGNPFRSKALSAKGQAAFLQLMRDAIQAGNEVSLKNALADDSLWNSHDAGGRRINVLQAAERLATSEFSTWYVRGLSRRLLDEGVKTCEVYRGAQPRWEPGECAAHEGMILDVQTIYDNHRIRYWPEPGNNAALSIPFGPGCHHLIKRA